MGADNSRKHYLIFFAPLFVIGFLRYFPFYINEDVWWADTATNGNFAYHFVTGRVILPFFAYQFPYWIHGSQVINALLIPLYCLSKPFYGWISLVGLLMSSAILAVSASLLKWELEKKHFWAMAFVFIFLFFPPPVYAYFMRALWANHFETTVFFVISLTIFCWAAGKEKFKLPLFVLGLFLGFSCFFCYTAISFASALAVSFWYLKGRFFLKNLWLFVLGFLIGFLPAILYNLVYENVILNWHLRYQNLIGVYSEAYKSRTVGFYAIYDLMFKVMPRFLYGKLNAQSIVFALLLGASIVYLLWQIIFKRDKSPLKIAILTTFLIYSLFYAAHRYAVFDYTNMFDYRYLVFLIPAMAIAIGLLLEDKIKILAPIVAIALAIGSGQGYRYPSSMDEFKYYFQKKKGYDVMRIYCDNMQNYLSKNPTKVSIVATKVAQKTSGFERVVALKGLGSFRWRLFNADLMDLEGQITSIAGKGNRKWLAFGWGIAQAICLSQPLCDMPLPALLSDEERKWFTVGFIAKHFWSECSEEGNFTKGEDALVDRLSSEDLIFALGFSTGETAHPTSPWPDRSKRHLQVIQKRLDSFGGLQDPVVREQFWKGVGCETAYWFLSENILARQQAYNDLMTPPAALQSFNPDAASLAIGWQECLAEFGCRQTEYDTDIGKVIKVVCAGEEF